MILDRSNRPDEGGFFGRAGDLEQLAKLLEPSGALVTIVGPPGVGKTRLALELVRGASFDHLVCELGEVRTSDTMLERLAELLHVGPEVGERERPLVRVGDALAEREGLVLVFDNVEQLIEVAAPVLRALRQASPCTRWLVTSRMALGLVGEWRHEIAPLGVEPSDGGESDAARMLADRVTRARGSPPDTEHETLARIGARLDGLPLALELAASRIAAIGAVAVEARLEQPLELLTRGPRELDHRQRTLRHAIAWSWDLLGANERRGLARLSVFRGGFDLAAAEAVVDAPDALDVIQALRDRSLLHTQLAESGEMRFGLYLSIREFAAGELDDTDSAAAHERHAHYYAALAERAPSALLVDRDNIFAAIERCVVRPSHDTFTLAGRLLLGLDVLIDRSPLEPFLDRLEAFLATTESVELLAPELRCELQITAGRCMRRLGRMRDAKRTYADALAIARLIRATEHEARLRGELGMVAYFESRLDDALGQWQTSIAMYAELGDDRRLGLEQTRCAMVLRESNRLDKARTVLEQALATHRRCDDADGIVITLAELAQIHFELGELDLGTQLLAEAERFPIRSLLSETAVLARNAFARWEGGDYARGEVYAQRALVHLAHIGYRRIEAGLTFYLAIARYLAGQARPVMELEWARRQLEGDRRAVHLCGAWLAYLTIADDREVARARFDALPPLPDGDPFAVVSAILRLPLDPGPWDQRAAALGAAPLGIRARSATASSIDVRLALRAVSASRAAAPSPTGALLEVRPDGDAFTIDGTVHSLLRYRTLRRLLLRLVDMRLAAPTVALPWDQLFASGWPGERVHAASARNRVKVAISTLRSMGLRDAIAHDGNGYLLDPAIEVRVVRRD